MKVNLQRSKQGKRNYVFWICFTIVLWMVGVSLFETCPFEDGVSLKTLSSQKDAGIGLQKRVTQASTIKWHDWPAIAYAQPGNPLVFKGNSFFLQARELYLQTNQNGRTLLDEFLKVYKNRPDPVNMCGIRINHALALFLAVKIINPTLVVESGVNAGVSTYFIRSASPSTRIYAIDPEEKPICGQGARWIDHEGIRNKLTINYTGKQNFKDMLDLDWAGMIRRKEIDPDTTLVFLDDHLHSLKRIAALMKVGIRHVLVEDNYKYGKGKQKTDVVEIARDIIWLTTSLHHGTFFIQKELHHRIRRVPRNKCFLDQNGKKKASGCFTALFPMQSSLLWYHL